MHIKVNKNTYDNIKIVPIILFLAVVLLIVRRFDYTQFDSSYFWINESEMFPYDYFYTCKRYLVYISAVLSVLIIIIYVIKKQIVIKFLPIYIPMFLYCLFVLLSWCFSPYNDIDAYKWYYSYEGTILILCYIILLFYIINAVDSGKIVYRIVNIFLFSTFLVTVLGTLQVLDMDPLNNSVVIQKLIHSKFINGTNMWELIDYGASNGVTVLMPNYSNTLIQTFGNLGLVNLFIVMVLPIISMLFFNEKKTIKKVFLLILAGLMWFNLLSSITSAAILGIIVTTICFILIFRKLLYKWKYSIIALFFVFIIVGAFNLKPLLYELTTSLDNGNSSVVASVKKNNSKINYFETGKNALKLSINDNLITIMFDDSNIKIHDENNKKVSTTVKGNTVEIIGQKYGGLFVKIEEDDDNKIYKLGLKNIIKTWRFVIENDTVYFLNDLNKKVTLKQIEHWIFEDNPTFGNYRGYIWSVSLPMLKETLLIGHGASTFWISHPNNDYVGKYNAGWDINKSIVSPHNMYLGIAINTGVMSLFAFLGMCLIYILNCIKIYKNNEFNDRNSLIGAALFLSVIAYLVIMTFLDSEVGPTSVFYGLFGLGIAVNSLVIKKGISKDIES